MIHLPLSARHSELLHSDARRPLGSQSAGLSRSYGMASALQVKRTVTAMWMVRRTQTKCWRCEQSIRGTTPSRSIVHLD